MRDFRHLEQVIKALTIDRIVARRAIGVDLQWELFGASVLHHVFMGWREREGEKATGNEVLPAHDRVSYGLAGELNQSKHRSRTSTSPARVDVHPFRNHQDHEQRLDCQVATSLPLLPHDSWSSALQFFLLFQVLELVAVLPHPDADLALVMAEADSCGLAQALAAAAVVVAVAAGPDALRSVARPGREST